MQITASELAVSAPENRQMRGISVMTGKYSAAGGSASVPDAALDRQGSLADKSR